MHPSEEHVLALDLKSESFRGERMSSKGPRIRLIQYSREGWRKNLPFGTLALGMLERHSHLAAVLHSNSDSSSLGFPS